MISHKKVQREAVSLQCDKNPEQGTLWSGEEREGETEGGGDREGGRDKEREGETEWGQ